MQHINRPPKALVPDHGIRPRWGRLLTVLCALSLLVAILDLRRHVASTGPKAPADEQAMRGALTESSQVETGHPTLRRAGPAPMPGPAAEEIVAAKLSQFVAAKLSQFARSRRGFAQALARRHNVQISGDVERFFAAVESGNWEQIETAFKKINGGNSSASWVDSRLPEVNELWPAIIDAYGVAEQVHEWPAQQLLDRGNAILNALRPGMVYVGGTDDGRWIPELLNDTSDGERHIIITQNALAASDYLEYVRLQYDGRLANLSEEDSQGAFAAYLADAQKRLTHDQQFPDEPKQILPNEDISVVDGKVQVRGQTAVMAINERLLQILMQKNPDLSFALQESFPLRSTYADALPLGPLMELQAGGSQGGFSPDVARQSLEYWQNNAQQVLSNPEAAGSENVPKSNSHDTVAAANLLASHGFTTEAQEAYRLASQLWPSNPEAVGGLADLLAAGGRREEARQILDNFAQQHPDERKDLERTSAAWRLLRAPGKP